MFITLKYQKYFLKLCSFWYYLCQGKQHKQITKKECFEGIYFNFKSKCGFYKEDSEIYKEVDLKNLILRRKYHHISEFKRSISFAKEQSIIKLTFMEDIKISYIGKIYFH